MTPPLWLRNVIPWRLLSFISDHTNTCWAGMAMWKLGYAGWSWWPQDHCYSTYDYCGKFRLPGVKFKNRQEPEKWESIDV